MANVVPLLSKLFPWLMIHSDAPVISIFASPGISASPLFAFLRHHLGGRRTSGTYPVKMFSSHHFVLAPHCSSFVYFKPSSRTYRLVHMPDFHCNNYWWSSALRVGGHYRGSSEGRSKAGSRPNHRLQSHKVAKCCTSLWRNNSKPSLKFTPRHHSIFENLLISAS